MSARDDENAARAARLTRDREFSENFRPQPDPRDRPFAAVLAGDPAPARPCGCGCQDGAAAAYPAGLGDIPPSSGQPAAVLLAWQLGHRSDPAAVREEARSAAAADFAEPRLDGWEALRMLGVRGNPDGGRLSGSRALALIRQLGIAGVGHEPGCAP